MVVPCDFSDQLIFRLCFHLFTKQTGAQQESKTVNAWQVTKDLTFSLTLFVTTRKIDHCPWRRLGYVTSVSTGQATEKTCTSSQVNYLEPSLHRESTLATRWIQQDSLYFLRLGWCLFGHAIGRSILRIINFLLPLCLLSFGFVVTLVKFYYGN